MEDWVLDVCSKDAFQSIEGCSLPLTIKPLAFSRPMGVRDNCERLAALGVGILMGKDNHSEWFQSKFNEFDDFLGTSLNGLEKPAIEFLLVVEAELQPRTTEEKIQRIVKILGRKGIRELRGLFTCVNYGSTSARHSGNSRERALIVSQ